MGQVLFVTHDMIKIKHVLKKEKLYLLFYNISFRKAHLKLIQQDCGSVKPRIL